MTEFVLDSRAPSASDRSKRAVPEKRLAGLLGALLVGATLAPIVQNWRPEPKDSFPFSYYPMFSDDRHGEYTVNYIVGLDEQGGRHLVEYDLVGKGGFNSTRRQINKLVRRKQAGTLCASFARAVAQQTDTPYVSIGTIRVVTGRFRFHDYFGGNKAPLEERVHASCQVTRGEP